MDFSFMFLNFFRFVVWGCVRARAHTRAHECKPCLRLERDIGFPGARNTGSCDLPYMALERNLSPLEKQVRLTPKPSLQAHKSMFSESAIWPGGGGGTHL